MFRRHDPATPSNADRRFQPTESWDLYRFQSVRRVPADKPVWTRQYLSLLMRDGAVAITLLLGTIALLGAFGSVLTIGEPSLVFVGGIAALVAVLGAGLHTFMRVDTAYATEEETRTSQRLLPDMAGLEGAYAADLRDRIEARRRRAREQIRRREHLRAQLMAKLTGRRAVEPVDETSDLAPVIPIDRAGRDAA